MEKEITAESVWKEYLKGEDYHERIGLHERVKRNEEFYNGDQWKGLNAPNLEKPVINIFHPAVTYFISQIVSDDIGFQLDPYIETDEKDHVCKVLTDQLDRITENAKEKSKIRELVRDAAIDGDGALYYYFDPSIGTEGEICAEVIDNDKVIFCNPYLQDVQKQKYIILVKRMMVCEARELAKSYGIPEDEANGITADDERDYAGESKEKEQELCTILLRFWRENGKICFCESAKNMMLREKVTTGQKLYPVVWFPWEKVKNGYHGAAALTSYIPNQIYVNKMWAMAMTFSEKMAFPTRLYDASKLPQGLSNRIGQAIGVPGSPKESVFIDTPSGNMSDQVLGLVQQTIDYTRMSMGVSDAALGDIKPENTSAIIAVQEAAAAPLEIQRRGLHQAVEDGVLIKLDLIREFYGLRAITDEVTDPLTGETYKAEVNFDFRGIDFDSFETKVNVGQTTYWSELMAIQTMDALFSKGILTDAVTYLESLPDGFVPHRTEIIDKIKEQQQAAMMAMVPPELPTDPAAQPATAEAIEGETNAQKMVENLRANQSL